MSIFEIPIVNKDGASFSESFFIENIEYKFVFQWNSVDESWVLSIFDIIDTPIILGIKLILNYELIQMHAEENMPSGYMFLFDLSNKLYKCNFDDLGSICRLYYITK